MVGSCPTLVGLDIFEFELSIAESLNDCTAKELIAVPLGYGPILFILGYSIHVWWRQYLPESSKLADEVWDRFSHSMRRQIRPCGPLGHCVNITYPIGGQ